MAYPSFSGRTAPAVESGTLDTTGASVTLAPATQSVSVYAAAAAYYRWSSDDDWAPIPATTWIEFAVSGKGGTQITALQLKADSGTPAVYIDCSPFPRS